MLYNAEIPGTLGTLTRVDSLFASPRSLLTVGQLAAYLRVHSTTIYRIIKTLPRVRVAGSWRFRVEEIDRFFADSSKFER
jgi:excisionase family DNA binding protein